MGNTASRRKLPVVGEKLSLPFPSNTIFPPWRDVFAREPTRMYARGRESLNYALKRGD